MVKVIFLWAASFWSHSLRLYNVNITPKHSQIKNTCYYKILLS